MKFHTKFRPGDLVKDKKTGDEGVIIAAEAEWWDNKNETRTQRYCNELKRRNETYLEGSYGIFPKTRDSSLNGWWYHDDQLELVAKGHLHDQKREKRLITRALKKTFINIDPKLLERTVQAKIDFAKEFGCTLEEAKEKLRRG